MIAGQVNDEGVPVVLLPVAGQAWLSTIDTGFNGDLELPERLRSSVNPRYLCRNRSLLAGGQTIEEEIYLVEFPFDGQTVVAEASFVDGSDILLGTRLLQSYRLEINFVMQTVLLERAVGLESPR